MILPTALPFPDATLCEAASSIEGSGCESYFKARLYHRKSLAIECGVNHQAFRPYAK